MKTRYFFLVVLMLTMTYALSVNAQVNKAIKNKIFITGAVYDSETKEPLSNAQFNIRKSEIFTTFSKGKFSLYGNPGDTISYRYLGYKEMKVVIPDTLKQLEYLMGVFMPKDTILIPEIVIFPRIESYPSIVTDVKDNAEMINQAQINVNKATVQGLTTNVGAYNADMNAKMTLRNYEMKAQHNGLLVTPENSVGISNTSYQTHYLQFGSPLVRPGKMSNEMVNQNEINLIIAIHDIMRIDTIQLKHGKR
jgi:hypothetical protein